jgi:hypothetical protein
MLDKTVPPILKHYGGVYIISQFSDPSKKSTSRCKIKIGMAKKDLYTRIDSYNTILCDSFWLYSCILCKNAETALELEKYIHAKLNDYRYQHYEYQARLQGEFFFVRRGTLKSVVNDAIRDKIDVVRGLFNFNPIDFELNLPPNLPPSPIRTVYEGVPMEPKVSKPLPKRQQKNVNVEEPTFVKPYDKDLRFARNDKDLAAYTKKHSEYYLPKTDKRERKVVKYTK